jgi:Fe-Mn family superoxide dismutase
MRYAYGALAPVISEEDLRDHHSVWHQGYVERLNTIVANEPSLHGKSIEWILRNLDSLSPALRAAVAEEGGGHANHQFFWKLVGPDPKIAPTGTLADALERDFGSFAAFKEVFEQTAAQLTGDGWAFLVADPRNGFNLKVLALPGNGSVLPLGLLGLLVCDLWAHACGSGYAGERARWVANWWQILDWGVVELRYAQFVQGQMTA